MDLAHELERLSALHQSGALTDAEFEAAKDRILHSEEALQSRVEYAENGPARPISKAFFVNSICGGLWLGVLVSVFSLWLLALGEGDPAVLVLAFWIGVASMLYGAIVHMVLVYRMWASLPYGRRRTTPAAAVGLLFVPLFNWYWCFEVYLGWCKDYNRMASAEGAPLPHMPEVLAKVLCIFMVLACVPYIGLFFLAVNLFILAAFVSSACDGINALARHAESGQPAPTD